MKNYPFDLDISDYSMAQALSDESIVTPIFENFSEIKTQCSLLFPLNNHKVPSAVYMAEKQTFPLGCAQTFLKGLYNQCAIPLGIVAMENAGLQDVACKLKQHFGCKKLCDKVQVGQSSGLSALALAATTKTKARSVTVQQFHASNEDVFVHYRATIYAALNETETWIKYLAARGLLAGEGVEKMVAQLKRNFAEDRKGNPAKTIVGQLCHDKEFATTLLTEWCEQLLDLGNDVVTTEVLKLRTWLTDKEEKQNTASTESFNAQSELRQWFDKHGIGDADKLISMLRAEDCNCVETLAGFSKQDLKDCGLTIGQANKVLKAFGYK